MTVFVIVLILAFVIILYILALYNRSLSDIGRGNRAVTMLVVVVVSMIVTMEEA